MASVCPKGQTSVFSSSNESKIIFLSKFFLDVYYDLINGVNLSRVANGPIFKFKRAPKSEKLDFNNFCMLKSMDF
ncbi:hypothetical protein H5410_056089 [Solanum commersonii]|uniref:Uncharacterized protein n=1 Tax=Solanum commersonii TaxID=4109 RepID=A0A9J5WJB4_SOLCO|nr:hypothetical protein H5410_056089 [Solanum commersonii]